MEPVISKTKRRVSGGKIIRVPKGSLAEELGLVPGDSIISVNDIELRDIIDLSFAFVDDEIRMLVAHADESEEIIEFDKDYDEELGVEFESAVFNGIRRCGNHCLFCFVENMAPDMRDSLYIKDDDYRLSFLYGNFVTLTNLTDADFDRIARYHLSPLFISVHATDLDTRAKLLRTPRARELHMQLDRLASDGIEYHTQVVLCPGINDGEQLDRTVRDIISRQPEALSIAIVPVGLTKFRTDKYPLDMFNHDSAARVIEQIRPIQEEQRELHGRTFVYLSDEFYMLAGVDVPAAEEYDGFPQLDNGIGLTRNFIEEFNDSMRTNHEPAIDCGDILVISGTSIAGQLQRLADSVSKTFNVNVDGVVNYFFGQMVNVSGLLTGTDIAEFLKGYSGNAHHVLIPEGALRAGEDVFLDDMSLSSLRSMFTDMDIKTAVGGRDFFLAIHDWNRWDGRTSVETEYMWQSNAGYTKIPGMDKM